MNKNILALAILGAIATPAVADDSGKYYLATDLGKMTYSNASMGGAEFSKPGALRISGGYRFSPGFAVEAGYAIFGDATLNSSSGSAKIQNSALQVAAVGTLLTYEQFELFGKLGVSINSTKASGSGAFSGLSVSHTDSFSSMLGLGVQYNVSRNLGIRAEYEKLGASPMTNNSQTWNVSESLPSLGVVYKF